MAERSPYLSGLNALLAFFTLFVAVGLLILFFGPGRRTLDGARGHLQEIEAELDGFTRLRASHLPLAEKERGALEGLWRQIERRFPDVVTESDLTALAAGFFRRHGVERVQVSFGIEGEAEQEEGVALARALLQSPDGSASVEVVPSRMRIRFELPFEDVQRVLAALQSGELPARIESATLQRTGGGVAVDLRLTLFTRSGRA